MAPAHAGSLTIGEPGYGGNYHSTSGDFTVSAQLQYQPGASNAIVNFFKININGIDYDAATTPTPNGFQGTVTIPRPLNPQRFVCYAFASVTWTYYYTQTEAFDSLNPVSGQNALGDGKKQEYILSNIKLKGLTWKNRPGDIQVYEHETPDRAAGSYPNATQPFHWRQYRDANGDPTTTEQHSAVYLMGNAPTLEVETEPLDSDVEVRAIPKVEFFNGSGGGALPAGYPFNGIAPLSGTGNNVGSVVCSPLKSEVNYYYATITVKFECKFLSGAWKPIYGRPDDLVSNLRLFTVYSAPGAPMATPWEGVLNDACRWAAGQNTAATVAEKLTTGFYFSQKAIYEPSRNWWTSPTNAYKFRLTGFLNGESDKLNPQGLRYMDCRDVSHYMAIIANVQGLGFTVSPYYSNPDMNADPTRGDFLTNNLCRMGYDPSAVYDDTKYAPFGFVFHQVAHSSSRTVYDASNAHKYDLSGNGFRNPPFNWPLESTATTNGYWQTTVPPGTSDWNPVGLVALPNPSAPASYPVFIPISTPSVE